MASEHYINSYRDLALNAIEDLKNYANDERPERRIVSYREYTKDLERLDSTRPAPAATDTGLETFSVEMLRDYAFMKADPEGDYVTRSQAEKLLAAKDREVEAAMVIYRAERKWRSELEAKLAAAVKALETKSAANEALSKSVVESIDTEKRLRDALEPFGVFGDETISPARRHFLQLLICPEGDEHPQDYGPHFRKARAVLGGKPS